jgi:diguanylate cyclase (GGDEF)-like protein
MFKDIKKSQTIVYLLIGYAISIVLFSISWIVTTSQLNDHVELIQMSRQAAQKMNVTAHLIEISRTRTRLSHLMMLTDDVFEKDAINQSITALASDFAQKREELGQLDLSPWEQALLDSQREVYPVVIDNLEKIADLILDDTEEAKIKARQLLVEKVVPNQTLVVDSFMRLLKNIEEEVKAGSIQMDQKHLANLETRLFTLVFVIVLSAWVMFIVIKNIFKIETRLYELSTSDPLTGVLNRRSFDKMIQQEWKRALREKEPLSLLFIDIDYFKKYNDRYGHQEGDRCLKKVAGVLKNHAHRSGDSVARYGGEEFAMILPSIDEHGAKTVADRLLEKVRSEHITHSESDIHEYVTISIGLASTLPTMEQSYEGLIRASDQALYQSKRAGRNRVTIYQSEKDGKVIELFSPTGN